MIITHPCDLYIVDSRSFSDRCSIKISTRAVAECITLFDYLH